MSEHSVSELALLFTEVDAELAGIDKREDVLCAITALAVRRIPGAQQAGITLGHRGEFRSTGETHELVDQADRIQYALRSGPCVDAAVEHACFNATDLRTDDRWPEFGTRAYEKVGVISMLSHRLSVEQDTDLVAAINMYSDHPAAFGAESEILALALATVGALAASAATHAERARHLETALNSNREIGIAIGVLMSQHRVTRDQGFNLLRMASQATQRKLVDLASEVVETGTLPEIRRARSS